MIAADWLLPAEVQPARDPRPVLLLPGFLSHASMMHPLAHGLSRAGHKVRDWGLCVNMGPSAEKLEQLVVRIDEVSQKHGQKVALVGWSLGGLYGREAARRLPDAVHCVITMGTPFSGDRRANNAWRLYQFITGHDVDEPPVVGDFAVKPPVETVALWSRRDGIIDPRSARGRSGESDAHVEMHCTHLGFASDARVLAEVLRQLDRVEE